VSLWDGPTVFEAKAKPGDRLIDHPEVVDALTLFALAAFPELGVVSRAAAWALRAYVRLQILQAIALEFAAWQMRHDFPKAMTGRKDAPAGPASGRTVRQRLKPREFNVPDPQKFHKQLTEAAIQGAQRGLSGQGRVQRHGDKLHVNVDVK
jgi:hypothetical protein